MRRTPGRAWGTSCRARSHRRPGRRLRRSLCRSDGRRIRTRGRHAAAREAPPGRARCRRASRSWRSESRCSTSAGLPSTVTSLTCMSGVMSKAAVSHAVRVRRHLHARGGCQREVRFDRRFNPEIPEREVWLLGLRVLPRGTRRKTSPGVEVRPVVARDHLTREDLFRTLGIVHQVEIAALRAVQQRREQSGLVPRAVHQVQRQARLVARPEIAQDRRPLLIQKGRRPPATCCSPDSSEICALSSS